MPDLYKGCVPIIDTEGPATDFSHPYGMTFTCVPRDYAVQPASMFAQPDEMEQIPESEWDARYDEQEATKSSLEHLYLGPDLKSPAFVNLDQGQDGDCWAYSTGHALMLDRLKRGLPLVRLNPHGVAAMLNRPGTGGWCGLSGEFATAHGYPEEGTGPGQWPHWSHNKKYDTPELRAAMAKYRVTENWMDARQSAWDRNLTTRQQATNGFNNNPAPSDFNWWGHSVLQIRWVRIEKGSWGPLILNSWKGWGRFGLAVLQGRKATCDGGLAVRSTTA